MEISGRLTAFSPAELLQWAHHERRTGALVVRRSRREKRIYFKDGQVVACLSDNPADYYGQFLLLQGHLTESDLVEALSHCARKGQRLGVVLTELKLLTPEEVRETLNQQIQDSVCGLFLWHHGIFFFEVDEPPEEEILPNPIRTMALVMEGTRWIDEHARFRKLFPHDNVVLRKGPSWPGGDLNSVQKRIVAHVNGERTLAKVHGIVQGPYFRVLEGVYQLCMQEVLDLGQVGEATESTSLELNVYDLLLEQAIEEQVLAKQRQLHFPMDVVGELHPVWIGPPPATEQGSMTLEQIQLWEKMGGTHTVAELIPTPTMPQDGDGGRLEFFLEQIRKGRVALLPDSPENLEESLGNTQGSWWRKLFSRK